MCVCVCVRACVRACVRTCVLARARVCVTFVYTLHIMYIRIYLLYTVAAQLAVETLANCFLSSSSYFFPSFSPSLPLSLVLSQGPCVKGVTMYSWLVTVLLLATAASNSRGQGAKGAWDGGRLVCTVRIYI